ncbi:MAG: hypothetical protein ACK4GU_00475 [Alishewanella aestuarii]
MPQGFIEQKSRQLVFYASRFLRGQLPQAELHLFIWDTLEEWAALPERPAWPPSYQERVFWHLLHQLEYWPEQQLRADRQLKRRLQHCLGYLAGKGQRPADCVGLRPL